MPIAVDFVFVPRCPCPRPDGNGMDVAARGLKRLSDKFPHKPGATAGVVRNSSTINRAFPSRNRAEAGCG